MYKVGTPSTSTLTSSPATAFVPVNDTTTGTFAAISAAFTLLFDTLAATEGAEGALGATVSKMNVVDPAGLGLPDASVATAFAVIVPLFNVATCAGVKATACGEPVPVTVTGTECVPSVKVTTVVAPASAVTSTTPPTAAASAAVAPLSTPVPNASVGAVGARVSTLIAKTEAGALTLPATSVMVALTLTAP